MSEFAFAKKFPTNPSLKVMKEPLTQCLNLASFLSLSLTHFLFHLPQCTCSLLFNFNAFIDFLCMLRGLAVEKGGGGYRIGKCM